MPTLTLTVASAPVSVPSPDPDDPDTQIWYTPKWEPVAYFFAVGPDYWVYLPRIASYRVAPGGDVLAVPEPEASENLVLDAYRRTVLPQALQFFGREVIHASALLTDAGVVGFCAYSQTGKSTLAYGLSRRGYRLWADDALVFETTAAGARALSLPFAIRLRPASRSYFGVAESEPTPLRRDEPISVGGESRPLAALCLLSRLGPDEEQTVDVRRLAAADVVAGLLPHAYWVSLRDGERRQRMLRAYLELAGLVPVYEARFPVALQELPKLMNAIERVVLRRADAA